MNKTNIINIIIKSVLAGILIALAGHIYLNCSNDPTTHTSFASFSK